MALAVATLNHLIGSPSLLSKRLTITVVAVEHKGKKSSPWHQVICKIMSEREPNKGELSSEKGKGEDITDKAIKALQECLPNTIQFKGTLYCKTLLTCIAILHCENEGEL